MRSGARADSGEVLFGVSCKRGCDIVREFAPLHQQWIDTVDRLRWLAGIDQVVLMGAGFDARALRLGEIAARGARVYEVDFPVVLERKRALLEAAGVKAPSHVAYVACDFMNPDFAASLRSDLAASGFRLGGGALFVWEGVIAYIDRAAVDRTLAFMANAGGSRSRLTFEYAAEAFAPDTAAKLTAAAGFDRFVEVPYDDLWRRWLNGEPHPNASIPRSVVASIS